MNSLTSPITFVRHYDTMTWLADMEYLCQKWPRICSTHSWLITGFVTRLTRRVPHVKQELPTLPDHLRSPPVFSGVRVTRSLVLRVCFVDRCLSFCTFSFGNCVVCSSSIYGFWYLQTLLNQVRVAIVKLSKWWLHLNVAFWSSI